METSFKGSTAQVNLGTRPVPVAALFHSTRDIALIIDKTVLGGDFGHLNAGTVMADYDSDAGLLVPYVPAEIAMTDAGRAFIASDVTAAKVVTMTNTQASKFAVGHLVIGADTDGATDAGAVTAVTMDVSPGMATVTVTNNLTLTVAKKGNLYHKAGDAGNFSTATCIIDKAIEVGTDGANTSVVLSNAVLYTASLNGLDTAAKTALGVVSNGQFTILK